MSTSDELYEYLNRISILDGYGRIIENDDIKYQFQLVSALWRDLALTYPEGNIREYDVRHREIWSNKADNIFRYLLTHTTIEMQMVGIYMAITCRFQLASSTSYFTLIIENLKKMYHMSKEDTKWLEHMNHLWNTYNTLYSDDNKR